MSQSKQHCKCNFSAIGDSAIAIADVSMAKKVINWQAKRNLDQMCLDSWNWQTNNP